MYAKYIKRPLDFILSLIAIILLSPLLLIVAILVRIKLGKPVIFKQQRPGKNEKIFTLYKFRTMTDKKDENGNLLPDEQRLTNLDWLDGLSDWLALQNKNQNFPKLENGKEVKEVSCANALTYEQSEDGAISVYSLQIYFNIRKEN